MKTCLPLAALLVLPILQPTSVSACGGYGTYFEPVDSVVVNLVDRDPRVAITAWRHLVALGDEGVTRLESAVRIEKQRLQYRKNLVDGFAEIVRSEDPHHQHMATWKRDLRRFELDLAQTKRVLAAASLVEPLRKAVRTNAPSA